MSEPQDVVEEGYDVIADEYLDWIRRIAGDPRVRFLEALKARLPASASVLDLGCGAGVPCTAALAEHFDVLGVDVSTAPTRTRPPISSPRQVSQGGHVSTWLRPSGLFLAALACGNTEEVTMQEPEGPATFQWVIAQPAPIGS